MNITTVKVRWSGDLPIEGIDASPIPARGGVYELLLEVEGAVEPIYVGEAEDLRRTFIGYAGGSKGHQELRRALSENVCSFRYWVCERPDRRRTVVAALGDSYFYQYGHDEVAAVACVRVQEM